MTWPEIPRRTLGKVAVGGLAPRRPDQRQAGTTRAGSGPAPIGQVFIGRLVIVSGAGSGVFLYSGRPGSGDLVESVTEASSDPYTNPTVPGFGSYDPVFGGVAQLHGALLKLFSGVNLLAQLGNGGLRVFNTHGALILSIDTSRDAVFLYADTGSATQGALIASMTNAGGTDSFNNATLGGLTSYGQIGPSFFATNSNGGVLNFLHATSVTGPWVFDGTLEAGTAAALGGTIFTGQPISADSWHNLALVNGWTGTARYRLLPDGRVELDLAISSAAATAFQFSTMPNAVIPANTVEIAAGANGNVATASNISPYVQVTGGTGVITMNGLHAFSTAGTWFAGGSYPLN